MKRATYTFCIPFRTPTWYGLSVRERSVLRDGARPILRQILHDCRPQAIICAGAASRTLLYDLSSVSSLSGEAVEGRHGRQRWTADATTAPWGTREVLRVPHFSRFNSIAGLTACGVWLASKVVSLGAAV
jgi:hypothetical protein